MKTLKATPRDIATSLAELRNDGLSVPAVLYNKDTNLTITVQENEVRSLYTHIKNNEPFTLNLAGTPYTVVMKDMQVHVVTGAILHMDFMIVS